MSGERPNRFRVTVEVLMPDGQKATVDVEATDQEDMQQVNKCTNGLVIKVSTQGVPYTEDSCDEEPPKALMSGAAYCPELRYQVQCAFMEEGNLINKMQSRLALEWAQEKNMNFYVAYSVPTHLMSVSAPEGFKEGLPIGIYLTHWKDLPDFRCKSLWGSGIKDMKKFPPTEPGQQEADAYFRANFPKGNGIAPEYFLHKEVSFPPAACFKDESFMAQFLPGGTAPKGSQRK